ncbi:3-phosphoshikimate 1-carboxyvinyltransferase [Brevundimonas sp.]|uniref:3-phosphoshikimate 1-carboxyvinyltransferase n=1 Tax=Brevundimonas sp. TaxID=1871086 RepID=UPI0025F5E678|nr:3-phosphoshikimate 1-carboxyvinyltransferase [Brevundimonas sp.]
MATDTGAPQRLIARPSGALSGRVRAPGDKSISHRALIFAAMAEGESRIDGLLESDDVLATARAAGALGASVERLGPGAWKVVGRGELRQPEGVIDCGNSGTAVRLLMGAAAGYPIEVRFDGDASLRSRPMGRVGEPLARMGARLSGDRLPLTLGGGGHFGGRLSAIDWKSEAASAQVKSAILLAGLNAEGVTSVEEPTPSRDHTERMLPLFGAEVRRQGLKVSIEGGQRLRAADIQVPGDPSSAAFPLVAALLIPGSRVTVEGVMMNPARAGLFVTLKDMGADLSIENERAVCGESVADLTARVSRLRGVVVPADRSASMIDEYPILAVAAACAEGPSVMHGLGELRVKESDRLSGVARLLGACGVRVEETGDSLAVQGAGRPPAGGVFVETHGDHRLAMSALVLGMASGRFVGVDRPEMISTSFPGFADLMSELGAVMESA